MKNTYNKNKIQYIKLNTSHIGGDQMGDAKFFNLVHYLDKKTIWDEKEKDRSSFTVGNKNIAIKDATYDEFNLFLTNVMKNRYHARNGNLKNLLQMTSIGDRNVVNLDFLDFFYHYLFKGSIFKKYLSPTTDTKVRNHTVFTEYKLTKKHDYVFADPSNACHIVEIMKEDFKRMATIHATKYGFVNIRELGRGAAGTASLFRYHENNNLMVAAKLMKSTQFKLTNDGNYLPLEIAYISDDHTSESSYKPESVGTTLITKRNSRFLYRNSMINYVDSYYPGYSSYNVLKINNSKKYDHIMLSVSGDNFTNQTIMHLILEIILENPVFGLSHNYIKQYDAMLCYKSEFTADTNEELQTAINDNPEIAYDYLNHTTSNTPKKNITIDGLNFMEVADNDLYNYLFDVQKQKFPHIKNIYDINENTFNDLKLFLDHMITQILQTLSVLQHPRYAFIHGDLKSKNIFIKIIGNNVYYKIADYDKCSITFNGIRFYNSGPPIVNRWMGITGPQKYDNVFLDKNIEKIESIAEILANKSYGIEQAIHAIYMNVLDFIDRTIDSNDPSINNLILDIKMVNIELYEKLISFFHNITNYFNKKLGDHSVKAKSDDRNTLNRMIQTIKKIKKKDITKSIDFNAFYTLCHKLQYMSRLSSVFENIEYEQMYVRYQPIPFFHTIDLYTLFLSLLQSPMIHVFLKYCMANKNSSIVSSSIFWNSFYDLWITDNDVYTVLGYYDYLYEIGDVSVNDMQTIGFILDPIKKNYMQLIRTVDVSYWHRVWNGMDKYQIIDNELKKQKLKTTFNLSNNTVMSLTMPNIMLSECGNFQTKFNRNKKIYYMDGPIIVKSAPSIGQKINVLGSYSQKNTAKDYIVLLGNELHKYCTTHKNDIMNGRIEVKHLNTSNYFFKDSGVDEMDKVKNIILNIIHTYTKSTGRVFKSYEEKQANICNVDNIMKVFENMNSRSRQLDMIKNIMLNIECQPSITKINDMSIQSDIIRLIVESLHDSDIIKTILDKYDTYEKNSLNKKTHSISDITTYDKFLLALKNTDHHIFTDIVNDMFTSAISTTDTLFNIAKTNIYKDAMYGINNWDYCNVSENDTVRILKEYAFI